MNSIQSKLIQNTLRWISNHPILAPLTVGIFVRICTAYWGLGFHARDDYFHVLQPALQWLADPLFNWELSGLPGAGIRSHFLPRLVQGLIIVSHSLGINNPINVLRFVYAVFGLYSSLIIPAAYFLARDLFGSQNKEYAPVIKLAPWIIALHFAMP